MLPAVGGIVVSFALCGALIYALVTARRLPQLTAPSTECREKRKKTEAQKKVEKILRSFGLPDIELTLHEMKIAANLVAPEDVNVTWEDIGGLENLTNEIRESVLLPLQQPKLFSRSRLMQAPKGMLLHGPPGCGKTMIAKAMARDSDARFINLDVSTLRDAGYGESQKLVSALFSLARKIQPCIIFVDEIDALLQSRDACDHETSVQIKAQFLYLWDGFIAEPGDRMVIIGATNRPQVIDTAVLRRMPAQFYVGLPDERQRAQIIEVILRDEEVSEDVDIAEVGHLTETFSGSDLKELCRRAAMLRVQGASQHRGGSGHSNCTVEEEMYFSASGPIKMANFTHALHRMKQTRPQTYSPIDLD